MPTVGIQNTNGWYEAYQCLVRGLPMLGTGATNAWYFTYQRRKIVGICILLVISKVSCLRQQGGFPVAAQCIFGRVNRVLQGRYGNM